MVSDPIAGEDVALSDGLLENWWEALDLTMSIQYLQSKLSCMEGPRRLRGLVSHLSTLMDVSIMYLELYIMNVTICRGVGNMESNQEGWETVFMIHSHSSPALSHFPHLYHEWGGSRDCEEGSLWVEARERILLLPSVAGRKTILTPCWKVFLWLAFSCCCYYNHKGLSQRTLPLGLAVRVPLFNSQRDKSDPTHLWMATKKEKINTSLSVDWHFLEMFCKTEDPFHFTSSMPLPPYSAFWLQFPIASLSLAL